MATKEFIKIGDGVVEITLSRPLDISGSKVKVLRMREPTVNDQLVMEESQKSDAMKELTLMANLCDMSPDDIRLLTLRDYKRVQVGLQTFFD